MDIRGEWLCWNVFVPIFTPIIISGIAVFLWWTLSNGFVINFAVILDVSPWALIFYTFTLISTTFYGLLPKASQNPRHIIWLCIMGVVVALYGAFMVIKRHDPQFEVGSGAYYVTLLLLVFSVVACHQSAKLK